MSESKFLKSVESSVEAEMGGLSARKNHRLDIVMRVNAWMKMQHNSTVRQLASYLTQLSLENEELQFKADQQHFQTAQTMFAALSEDEQQFMEAKALVDQHHFTLSSTDAYRDFSMFSRNTILNVCSASPVCAASVKPTHHQPRSECNNELQKSIAQLNNSFVAKEVKKIIRFKFGHLQSLDSEISMLHKRIENLRTQKKILQLLPEVYDKESLHLQNHSNLERNARHILHMHSKSQRSDLTTQADRKENCGNHSSCESDNSNYQDEFLSSNNSLDILNLDRDTVGKGDRQLDCCCRAFNPLPIRKSSTFLQNSDEENSGEVDSNESLIAADNSLLLERKCEGLTKQISSVKINNLSSFFNHYDHAELPENLLETLDASDLYNAAKFPQHPATEEN